MPRKQLKVTFSNWHAHFVSPASYLYVALFQFLLLYPLQKTMDLPSWDEAIYMGQGEQFVHGGNLGSLSDSPLFALLFSFFVRAFGTVGSIFYMQYFVKISVSLLLFHFLSKQL